MGGQNVAWMISNGGYLSDSAHRVAVFIALHARDIESRSEPANVYNKGAAFACEILYPGVKYDTARQRYTRAVRELIEAGLVAPTEGYGGRSGGRYRALRVRPQPVDN